MKEVEVNNASKQSDPDISHGHMLLEQQKIHDRIKPEIDSLIEAVIEATKTSYDPMNAAMLFGDAPASSDIKLASKNSGSDFNRRYYECNNLVVEYVASLDQLDSELTLEKVNPDQGDLLGYFKQVNTNTESLVLLNDEGLRKLVNRGNYPVIEPILRYLVTLIKTRSQPSKEWIVMKKNTNVPNIAIDDKRLNLQLPFRIQADVIHALGLLFSYRGEIKGEFQSLKWQDGKHRSFKVKINGLQYEFDTIQGDDTIDADYEYLNITCVVDSRLISDRKDMTEMKQKFMDELLAFIEDRCFTMAKAESQALYERLGGRHTSFRTYTHSLTSFDSMLAYYTLIFEGSESEAKHFLVKNKNRVKSSDFVEFCRLNALTVLRQILGKISLDVSKSVREA